MAIKTCSLVLCLFGVVYTSPINEEIAGRNKTCGENKVFTNCKKLCPAPTCENKDTTINCFTSDICQDGCNCKDGFWREGTDVYNDRCVPYSECTKLPSCVLYGEEYNECGTACEVTCDNHMQTDRACIAVCKSGCFCAKGKIRGPDGSCIYPHDCPKTTAHTEEACPAHEFRTNCTLPFCYKNCKDLVTPPACPSVSSDCYVPGCVCNDGWMRQENGSCVPMSQCDSGNITVTVTPTS